ncbi:MAG: hypothetical protein UX25_C0037G0003 [Candidatus Woesebacteria bacterium GW2011_GWC2_45_9]|uniref:Uncharacterized protein n=2 Tax=Microgenomates group TaxID=1794810 RepID=A0A0G1QEV2_9BACT|nr:MAG: hypothetical protein UW61_C0005G0003 [Candidatus Curtissbacteria bacterium GW2011_GWC1_44_33]KKU16268.1 MAG: hypothetical protein UX25_C0037G0003 [Candidatus Woesebacteria bacterium GW2011_GWC2_45_9]
MESQPSEYQKQVKEIESLTQKIQEKVEKLLKQDGRPIRFYRNFPRSLVAGYILEPPMEIGGISTLAPHLFTIIENPERPETTGPILSLLK